ncbi:MAG: alpha/beta hydrolase [Nanoarchaeota archaeon]|nr:alpha/beta hydrolase [Nanoarchaeota archaeon]MBU1051938.1 alpha/beta hydrolase [Nanoarchaeota archaeon]MBU1988175.1 alpha/beta hydrolase [Nanoarchaeota archaeon]
MAKQIFIIHRWEGSPEEPMLKWLAEKLTNKGYEVTVPKMPNPEEPKIDEWIPYLQKIITNPNQETFLIGHSIGCQTILRSLETLPENTKIRGILLIAPWLHLQGLETKEEVEIAKPWLKTPINLEKVKSHIGKVEAIFSDNDPYVPLSDKDIFKELLGAEIHIEHKKGHFDPDSGITELPIVLESFEKISSP